MQIAYQQSFITQKAVYKKVFDIKHFRNHNCFIKIFSFILHFI